VLRVTKALNQGSDLRHSDGGIIVTAALSQESGSSNADGLSRSVRNLSKIRSFLDIAPCHGAQAGSLTANRASDLVWLRHDTKRRSVWQRHGFFLGAGGLQRLVG
jgi:hypothetical protein